MATQQQQMSGDGFTALAGMSKAQLYEVMSKMKLLIETNQQQARQVLIENPLLTKALFQAQIMLGMVKPPQVMPNIQQTLSQPQSTSMGQQPNVPSTQSLQVLAGQPSQASSSQPPLQARQQHLSQPSIPPSSTSISSLTYQTQTMPINPAHPGQQTKGYMNAQVPPVSLSQSSQMHTSSQIHNLPLPPPPAQHYSIPPSNMPMASSQAQQSLQTPGLLHQQPLQPPLPQQPRPPSLQPFLQQQLHTQMPHSLGFQQQSVPLPFSSQPMFHPAGNPPSSFPHGQPPLPSQLLPQQLFQGGSHIGSDFGSQAGTSMQAERGAPWAPSLLDKTAAGSLLPGPPQFISGQTLPGPVGQPPRPPPLTPEMEKALLQQVMSLTPEQINLLPPEQQNQIGWVNHQLVLQPAFFLSAGLSNLALGLAIQPLLEVCSSKRLGLGGAFHNPERRKASWAN